MISLSFETTFNFQKKKGQQSLIGILLIHCECAGQKILF